MENKNLKKIITFLLIICWLIISVLSFKFIVLDENEKIDQAKSIKQINLKEERKIFGF